MGLQTQHEHVVLQVIFFVFFFFFFFFFFVLSFRRPRVYAGVFLVRTGHHPLKEALKVMRVMCGQNQPITGGGQVTSFALGHRQRSKRTRVG